MNQQRPTTAAHETKAHLNRQAMPRRAMLVALSLWAAAASLSGCGMFAKKPPPPPPPPPPPKPGTLSIQIGAADNINPDMQRRPSPVMVRIYELKASAPFESADFLSLFERDQATLGADLVARQEIAFRPGETKIIDKPLAADTKFIGVMVAFRELERARWRGLVEVQPHKDNHVAITLNGVTVQSMVAAR